MQIHNTTRRTLPSVSVFNRASSEKPESRTKTSGFGDVVEDFTVSARLLSLGLTYRALANHRATKYKKKPPLADSPPVKIDQPFVTIPGWKTTRDAFDPLADKLLEGGRNGGTLYFVQDGQFFHDRDCTSRADDSQVADTDGKVFEVVFSDVRLPPDRSAQELSRNLKAVKSITGADKLDVSAYSMGGLATREYLDNGGKDIDQLLILGTPNRGSEFAKWSLHVLDRDIKWAISLAGLLPGDVKALEWLRPERENPLLQDLNSRWDEQKANVTEVRLVAGLGTPSAKAGWNPVTDGDGLVAADSVGLPGDEPIKLKGQHHNHLNNNAKVYDQMRDFFGWPEDNAN